MTPHPEDSHPEDHLLHRLPVHDVDPALAEGLRRSAHALLLARAHAPAPVQGSGWSLHYHRVVEPAALLALGLGYLASSVRATLALFQ